MKGKGIWKLKTNRFLARLIVLIFLVMIVEFFLSCSQPVKFIPEELTGKYITTHSAYKRQFIELGSELITLGFGEGKYKYYNVKKIKKEMIENRILYIILCGNEDQGEEFNFAFFTDFAGRGIIHFKNKPQVAWIKKATDISFNDNSGTHNLH